jgi:hypothetical protein
MRPFANRWWRFGLALTALFGMARAEVLHVPQDYASIQAALDAVVNDDTVLVSLGTYPEELQAPPLRFWLIGDVPVDTGDFARPVVDPSSLDSAQWRKCMNVPAGSQPVIERMGFANRAPMYPRPEVFRVAGIEITSEDTATFRYCRFDSVYRAISEHPFADTTVHVVVEDCRFVNAPRIQVRTSFDGSATILRCYFQGRYCTSEFTLTGANSVIEECVFTADSLYRAVNLNHTQEMARLRNCIFGPIDTCAQDVLSLNNWSHSLVEGNVFRDIRTGWWDFGYLTQSGGEPIIFRHNAVINAAVYGNGMGTGLCIERQPGTQGLSAEVDSNLFMNCTSTSDNYRGKALGVWSPITATGNHFLNLVPESVAVVNILPGQTGSSGSVLRYNHFESRDYGVGSYWGDWADAVWNYWGDATGPYNATFNPQGLGARVDDPILFDPWCPDTNCFLSVPGIGRPLPEQFIFEAYPNPFNSTVHLKLIPSKVQIVKVELFDLLGRRVQEIWHGPLAFQKDITFDATALASGIYFARVKDVIDRKTMATAKLVLLK